MFKFDLTSKLSTAKAAVATTQEAISAPHSVISTPSRDIPRERPPLRRPAFLEAILNGEAAETSASSGIPEAIRKRDAKRNGRRI